MTDKTDKTGGGKAPDKVAHRGLDSVPGNGAGGGSGHATWYYPCGKCGARLYFSLDHGRVSMFDDPGLRCPF